MFVTHLHTLAHRILTQLAIFSALIDLVSYLTMPYTPIFFCFGCLIFFVIWCSSSHTLRQQRFFSYSIEQAVNFDRPPSNKHDWSWYLIFGIIHTQWIKSRLINKIKGLFLEVMPSANYVARARSYVIFAMSFLQRHLCNIIFAT